MPMHSKKSFLSGIETELSALAGLELDLSYEQNIPW